MADIALVFLTVLLFLATCSALPNNNFHGYGQIQGYLRDLGRSHSHIVTVGRLAEQDGHTPVKTFEGREIYYIAIGNNDGRRRPVVLIDAGIHAREWITIAVALDFIERLVKGYGHDSETTALVDNIDFVIVPVVNPDGYEYSRAVNRLWRKNRRVNPFSKCRGVDINRNFPWFWGTKSSTDACFEDFHGQNSLSEPESRGLSNLVNRLGPRLQGYITLHNYGQLVQLPFTHDRTQFPPHFAELVRVGSEAVQNMNRVHSTIYTLKTGTQTTLELSGTSKDWAAGAANIPYVFLFELPPVDRGDETGAFGFLTHPNHIAPIAREIWEGTKTIARSILQS